MDGWWRGWSSYLKDKVIEHCPELSLHSANVTIFQYGILPHAQRRTRNSHDPRSLGTRTPKNGRKLKKALVKIFLPTHKEPRKTKTNRRRAIGGSTNFWNETGEELWPNKTDESCLMLISFRRKGKPVPQLGLSALELCGADECSELRID